MRLKDLFSGIWKKRQEQTQEKERLARRTRTARMVVEELEDRSLMTTSVIPQILPQGQSFVETGTIGTTVSSNVSSPVMASDPRNPNNLFAVFTTLNTARDQDEVRGYFSSNGGVSWTRVSNLITPRTDPNSWNGSTFDPYFRITTPSVAWDRNGDIYIVATQHNNTVDAAGHYSSGAIVLSKYHSDGGATPTAVFSNTILTSWINQEPAYNPVVIVDANDPPDTDPQSGVTRPVDTMVGKAVYIAWNTRTQNGAGANTDRPYGVRLIASSDGGVNFTTPVWVADNPELRNPNPPADASFFPQNSPRPISQPTGLITQSSYDGLVQAGRLVLAYGVGSQITTDSSRPDGGNIATPVADVVEAFGATGVVNDAIFVDGITFTPQRDNAFNVTVNIPNPASFGTITDLDVSIVLQHPNLSQVRIELEAPAAFGGGRILLLDNAQDGEGNDTGDGVAASADPGMIPFGDPNNPNPLRIRYDLTRLAMIFDQQAGIDIDGNNSINTGARGNNLAPFLGRFRPEDSFDLGTSRLNRFRNNPSFNGNLLNGSTWVLHIIDTRNDRGTNDPPDPPPYAFLHSWSLKFSSGINNTGLGTDVDVGGSASASNGTELYAVGPAAPRNGIAPRPVLAQDKTRGSFSPYQGRVYVAYVTGNGTASDINIATSDNAGVSWGTPVLVNRDNSLDKINSQGNRVQFTPAISIDQMTGTVVVSYYDARWDASNARVVTMISTSIDGGVTWGLANYLNPTRTALDIITQNPNDPTDRVNLEPIPSNQVVANTTAGDLRGWGNSMGLFVHDGTLTAIYAGNLDGGALTTNLAGNLVYNPGSFLLTAQALLSAGPRVVEGDMGTVTSTFLNGGAIYNNTFASDGTRRLDSFVVRFDRPIDIASFTPADVVVRYRSVSLDASIPGELVSVASIVPLDDTSAYGPRLVGGAAGDLATIFRIVFTTPQTRVGTYSYSIGPMIRDRIRRASSTIVNDPAPAFVPSLDTPLAINDFTTTTSTIAISGAPGNRVVGNIRVRVNITHGGVGDLKLYLVAPDGTRVLLFNRHGGNGNNLTNTTFSDAATTQIYNGNVPYTGSFKPYQALAILNGKAINGNWRLEVQDAATGDVGTLDDWSIEITQGAVTTIDPVTQSNLLGNLMDQDGDGTQGEANVDAFAVPRPISGMPFELPYARDTLPLIIPGVHVVQTTLPTTAHSTAFDNFISSPNVPVAINDATVGGPGIATSTLNLGFAASDLVVGNVRVRISLTHTFVRDLRITLIAPDGTRVILFNREDGGGDDIINTVFDDTALTSISVGIPPYGGVFRPSERLASLLGKKIQGTWTLEIQDLAAADVGTLTSWGLEVTPRNSDILALNQTVNSIDVRFDRNIDPNTFTTADILRISGPLGTIVPTSAEPFRITQPLAVGNALRDRVFRIFFPTQYLSGSYVVTLGSNITARDGSKLDTNLNAGLYVLRGADPTSRETQTNSYAYTSTLTVAPGQTKTATITVNDAFPISKLLTKITLRHGNVSDLKISLLSPTGERITLADAVGRNSFPTVDFANTLFDDDAVLLIQQGAAPFTGSFKPFQALSNYIGQNIRGTWKLEIINRSATLSATLQDWQLIGEEVKAGTGLGETIADQFTTGFRIFTQDPTNSASSSQWTAVGPVAENDVRNAGQISSITVDPSDPTGNTVYASGGSSGIWKTTNFLTSNPAGPTWIPLTDLGPTAGISIGTLVVLPRNNDPKQTIILAGTGDPGSTGTARRGIGFLRSADGGATWEIVDGLVNYNGAGILPINSSSRDKTFVGTTTYRIIVDPTLDANNNNVLYIALSNPTGTNGGIYKSTTSGKSWFKLDLLPGQGNENATDIQFAQGGTKGSDGKLQILFAALEGQGVFLTQNAGANWDLMVGNQGRPLVRTANGNSAIPVANPASTPNGAKGRITLATPAATGNALLDFFYAGWVYAIVSTPNDTLDGLYVTKDYGRNWTLIQLSQFNNPPTAPTIIEQVPVRPTNDETRPTFDNVSSTSNNRAGDTLALSLAIDPLDPRIVYVGGNTDFITTPAASPLFRHGSLLRVDTTKLSDPQAFVGLNFSNNDGGVVLTGARTTGALNVSNFDYGVFTIDSDGDGDPDSLNLSYQDILNLSRNPDQIFLSLNTLLTTGAISFSNQGTDISWTPFDLQTDEYGAFQGNGTVLDGGGRFYGIQTIVDPLTGLTRLYLATHNGVYTVVDSGTGQAEYLTQIGQTVIPTGQRTGNMQVAHLTGGGVQASQLAADIQNALLYATTDERGLPQSNPDVLQTGDLGWNHVVNPDPTLFPDSTVYAGGNASIETDPSGTGAVLKFWFPADVRGGTLNTPGVGTDFVQLTLSSKVVTSRTNGLVEGGDNPRLGAGQWDARFNDSKLAINPYDTKSYVVGSRAGRVFRTVDNGLNWFPIAQPAILGNSGIASAVTFGAPETTANANLNNHIYAGTQGGRVYVTLNGGGSWRNITFNLDGSEVVQISANPRRGSYEVYVLTRTGVYWMQDSRTGTTWQNINAGNKIQAVTTQAFNNSKFTMPVMPTGGRLTAFVVDWRNLRHDDYLVPTSFVHPVIYVAGDGGVFRTLDKGARWTYFPNTRDGAAIDGGLLPHVTITGLELSRGAINPVTGLTDANNAASFLLATTAGRGAFAIRLEPEAGISGPRVLSALPTTPGAASMTSVDVTFDKGVDPTTFTVADVQLRRYDGVLIPVSSVTDVSVPETVRLADGSTVTVRLHKVYRVTFPAQTAGGAYTIVIGSNVSDFAGNRLNQNSGGPNGETNDSYTGRFFRNSSATNDRTVPAVVGLLPSGQVVASYSNGANSYSRGFWEVLPRTVTWARVSSADVNGDGYSDYIGRVVQTGEWWVSLGGPGPGYTTSRWATWSTSLGFSNLDVGDFNGDGRADIIGRIASTGQLYVGISTGFGFQSSVWGVHGMGLSYLRSIDVTGDGLADVVGWDARTGKFYASVSQGNRFVFTGFGAWAPSISRDLRYGDFNGDGAFDVAGREANTNRIWVMLSNGATFGTASLWTTWGAGAWTDVREADFTGDGRYDLYVRDAATGRLWVSVSTGTSFSHQFWGTVPLGSYISPTVAAVDVNADGKYDIVNRLSNGTLYGSVSVGSRFVTSVFGTIPTSYTDIVAGDFNRDRKADLIARNPVNGQLVVYRSRGNAFIASNQAVQFPTRPQWTNFLVGDFNGDGKDDYASRIAQNGQWYVSIGNGSTATRTSVWTTWAVAAYTDVQVGDFNGDGKDDILGRLGNQVFVAVSSGSSFTTTLWTTWLAYPWIDARVGDFNKDGRDDIAVRRVNTGQWFISRSLGNSFAPQTFSGATWAVAPYLDVQVGDFNGDGFIDIVGRQTNNNVFVLRSNGTGFVNGFWGSLGAGSFTTMQVGDFDGNGRDDVVARNVSNGQLRTGLSNGVNGFAMATRGALPAGGNLVDFLIADMDGDGKDEILSRVFSSGQWLVSFYNGTGFVNATWDNNYLAGLAFENVRVARRG